MRHPRSLVAGVAGALAFAAAPLASPLTAQAAAPAAPLFEVVPYGGYMIFGDFLKGPVGTSLSNTNGYVVGAQLGFKVTPQVAIVGNVAYASSDLEVGLPILGGQDVGDSKTLLYDAGVQLSVPTRSAGTVAVSPFIQAGIGAVRYDVSAAGLLQADATNLAFNAGIGADVMFGPSFGLRLMAKDYIGRFDVEEATSFGVVQGETSHNFALSVGLKLAF